MAWFGKPIHLVSAVLCIWVEKEQSFPYSLACSILNKKTSGFHEVNLNRKVGSCSLINWWYHVAGFPKK